MTHELPSHWVAVELEEIATIGPKSDVSRVADDQSVHFVPMAAVAENFAGIDISQLRPFQEVRKGYTSFAQGDVLFAKITPCMENGKGGVVPPLPYRHAFGSTEFHVVRPGSAVTPAWLSHFLSQPLFRQIARQNMTGSAGQLRVPTKWLASVTTPVAPLAEQIRIVAKLEELLSDLHAGVAELKAAQAKLAQCRQSLLKAAVQGALTADWRARHTPAETGAQLLARILAERRARWEARQLARFQSQGKTPPKGWQSKYSEPVAPDTRDLPELPEGWVWASIDQLSIAQRYGSSAKTSEDKPDGIPVLRMGNIQDGEVDLSSLKFLPCDHHEFPELLLEDGDLLFNRTNSPELVGKCAVYRSQVVPCSYASYLIAVRLSDTVTPEFVATFINSAYGRHWVKSVVSQQVGQANVNGSKLAALAIPLPPGEEQIEVSAVLSQQLSSARTQEQQVLRSLAQSAAQRQNLLKAAFSGQLVPQDPADEPASALLERIRAARSANTPTRRTRRTQAA